MKISLNSANLHKQLQIIEQHFSPLNELAKQFQLGKQFQATVLAQPRAGITQLMLNGQLLTTNSGNLALIPGQSLQLQVQKTDQQIHLAILSDLSSSQLIKQTFKLLLPWQDSCAPLLSTLLTLVNLPANKLINLPPDVLVIIQRLLKQLTNPKQVTTKQSLKQALNQSGTFWESHVKTALMQANSNVNYMNDFKALRLQLLSLVKKKLSKKQLAKPAITELSGKSQTPPPLKGTIPIAQPTASANLSIAQLELENVMFLLHQQLKASLARTEISQINSLTQENEKTQSWLLELPILADKKQVNIFQLLIQQEIRQQNHRASIWTLTMAFSLEQLGPMQVVLQQAPEHTAITFWSEHKDTFELVKKELASLRHSLKKQGITISELNCFLGQIPTQRPPNLPADPLLDVTA